MNHVTERKSMGPEPKGVGVGEGFKRVDEYIFIARFGSQDVTPSSSLLLGSRPIDSAEKDQDGEEDEGTQRIGLDWQTARRRDLQSVRRTRPGQFYPIYVNETSGLIEAVGKPIWTCTGFVPVKCSC
jgi:adenine-specific DNA-methyltransferase